MMPTLNTTMAGRQKVESSLCLPDKQNGVRKGGLLLPGAVHVRTYIPTYLPLYHLFLVSPMPPPSGRRSRRRHRRGKKIPKNRTFSRRKVRFPKRVGKAEKRPMSPPEDGCRSGQSRCAMLGSFAGAAELSDTSRVM